jgi:hypothetical protein
MRVSRKEERLSGCVHPVKDRSGLWIPAENTVLTVIAMLKITRRRSTTRLDLFAGCRTGFRRGFSQLTFCKDGGEYKPSGFPTQLKPIFLPVHAGQ